MTIPTLPLSNGSIPLLGFGTWKLTGAEGERAIRDALEIGYRHIDTADRYGNHDAVRKAINGSNVSRSDIFLTTKIHPMMGISKEDVIANVPRFLKELRVDYLDLLLVHWPNRSINMRETFAELVIAQEKGLIKNFGVSNFTAHHLEDMLAWGFAPAVNQVEYHLTLAQTELRDFCRQHGIALTAYSPLGRGDELQHKTVQHIAEKHDATAGQVLLRWLMDQNIVVIPKATSREHIADNFEALTLTLDTEDTATLNESARNDNRLVIPQGYADFDY